MADIVADVEGKMKKTLESTQKSFSGIRTGRATPAVLDGITVEYYGSGVPLKQIANITIPEARQLLVHPYDKNAVQDIEKAIQKSELGIQPRVEGGVIRLILPQLSEERRKDLVKVARKAAEESKVAIRNIRREALDLLRGNSGEGKLSEDAVKQMEERVQQTTDKFTKQVEELAKEKEKEILTL